MTNPTTTQPPESRPETEGALWRPLAHGRRLRAVRCDARYVPLYHVRLVREARLPLEGGDDGDGLLCRPLVMSPADVCAVVWTHLRTLPVEAFLAVLLNTGNRVLGVVECSRGGLSSAPVEPRAVFQAALLANAAAVVVAHNHPSGSTEPSREDVQVTKQLTAAGLTLGVPVRDHIIVAGPGRYTSLAERGLL